MKNYDKSWKSVLVLLFLMVCVSFTGYGYSRWFDVEVKALELQGVYEENAKLTVEVQVATASAKPVYLSEEQIKKLLTILMPKSVDREQFMKILKCENGTHDPKRVHVNKEGLGYDLGIAQINSRFHSNRVKEFFGQDFNEAMSDPVRNIVYAVYLYQHSGFNPWVCSKIALKGGV